MNEPLPQSGGIYILIEDGTLVRVDQTPQPAPFPATLTEAASEEASDGR